MKSSFLLFFLWPAALFSQGFELPPVEENSSDFKHIPPYHSPEKKKDWRELNRLILGCYPQKSFFENFNVDFRLQRNVSDYDSLEGSGNVASIIASIPLYSATNLERERDREFKRRADVAKNVAEFAKADSKLKHTARMLGLWQALEMRSQIRVREGIISISEQIQAMEKISKYLSDKEEEEAALLAARLVLLNHCGDKNSTQRMIENWLDAP